MDLSSPYSPDIPGSITGWHPPTRSPRSPTGSRLPVESVPVAGSLSPPPPSPPSPHPSQPGPSEDRVPNPPGFSVNLDTLSSTGSQPTPPQPEGPEVGPERQSLLHLETFPIKIRDKISKGKIKRHIN